MSGASNISCSCWISSMMRSTSMLDSIAEEFWLLRTVLSWLIACRRTHVLPLRTRVAFKSNV